MNAFFKWCAKRNYLSKNPLVDANTFNAEPEVVRRCLTVEEIQALFAVATLAQRTLLEVALLTGLRLDELRGLTVNHLDSVKKVLCIDAAADKGRKGRLQVVPDQLVDQLQQFIASGEAKRLYDRYYSRKDCTAKVPDKPLLFVPSHAARLVKELADKAGVVHLNNDGKIDFHAMRTTFINKVIKLTDLKSAQELAGHKDANTTLKIRGNGNVERIRNAVNAVADSILTSQANQNGHGSNPIIEAEDVQELARHEGVNTTFNVYGRGNEERMRAAINDVADLILPTTGENGRGNDNEP